MHVSVAHLGLDDDLTRQVGPRLERLANDALGHPLDIGRGRIDQSDTRVERGQDCREA